MKSLRQDRVNATVELDELSVAGRRKTSFLPDGCYLFEDVLQGDGAMKIITCTAWLLELYQLRSGELAFLSGGTRLVPETAVFGVLYPPFTISAPCFTKVRGLVVGLAGTQPLPVEFTSAPFLFDTSFTGVPAGVAQVLQILQKARNVQSAAAYPRPSLLSLKAKRLIDENYFDYPSIGRVAGRLGVTPAHLSRQFKFDYEMSPSNYLHKLRLADVPLRLAKGEEIVNVSENVGYNDLSRFYKQFRKTTSTSPGMPRALKGRASSSAKSHQNRQDSTPTLI